MGLPVENLDRLSTATDLLIDVFQSKANFIKLLSSYVAETQEIERMLMDMLDSFYVGTAEGDQLDAIGEIVGVDRQGLTDDLYRLRIRARILLNTSSGTVNQILKILQLMITDTDATIEFKPFYPAAFLVELGILTDFDRIEEIGNVVIDAAPAGVAATLHYGLSDAEFLFRFSATGSSESDPDKGFANLTQTTGGKLTGVISNV